MLISAALLLVGITSVVLFVYGLNMLYLSWRSFRITPVEPRLVARGEESDVAVQLPIYNERYVAERIIDAAARLDWPRDRLEIQVLDDSDDETVAIVAARVRVWQRRGLRIEHIRRRDRAGYKAGALAHGLELTGAGLIAIFDADFVPERDFLRRVVGPFADPSVGFVQARWGHLNERYSWITRLQALSIDFHFLVEQAVRSASGYLTNFTGTAGIWPRQAIVSAGGWNPRTLPADLAPHDPPHPQGCAPASCPRLPVAGALPGPRLSRPPRMRLAGRGGTGARLTRPATRPGPCRPPAGSVRTRRNRSPGRGRGCRARPVRTRRSPAAASRAGTPPAPCPPPSVAPTGPSRRPPARRSARRSPRTPPPRGAFWLG